jgi:hypothetical protein
MSTIGEDIIPEIVRTATDSQPLTGISPSYCFLNKKTGPRETGGLSCLRMQ